jgi:hypothetical protein
MKTGRLLKFARPGGDVHAYIYRDGAGVHASLFVTSSTGRQPVAQLEGTSEVAVETAVRDWVEERFPRAR